LLNQNNNNKVKYLDYIKKQIYLLSNKTNLIRFPIEKRVQEIEKEKKQEENMVNKRKPVS